MTLYSSAWSARLTRRSVGFTHTTVATELMSYEFPTTEKEVSFWSLGWFSRPGRAWQLGWLVPAMLVRSIAL